MLNQSPLLHFVRLFYRKCHWLVLWKLVKPLIRTSFVARNTIVWVGTKWIERLWKKYVRGFQIAATQTGPQAAKVCMYFHTIFECLVEKYNNYNMVTQYERLQQHCYHLINNHVKLDALKETRPKALVIRILFLFHSSFRLKNYFLLNKKIKWLFRCSIVK